MEGGPRLGGSAPGPRRGCQTCCAESFLQTAAFRKSFGFLWGSHGPKQKRTQSVVLSVYLVHAGEAGGGGVAAKCGIESIIEYSTKGPQKKSGGAYGGYGTP